MLFNLKINQISHTQKDYTMKKVLLTMGAALLASSIIPSYAQDEKPKFKFTPGGRILFDGALFTPKSDGFRDGVAMPDIRIGGTAEYGKWKAKIDIGYAFQSLGVKDVFLQYTFDPHNQLRAGYFVQQFGLQSATSSSMKPMYETPLTDSYMNCTGRNLGVMYEYDKGPFLATASMIFGNQFTLHENQIGRLSIGGISRLAWRPLHEQGKVVQVGVSGWYQSAMRDKTVNDDGEKEHPTPFFDYSANYPTRVVNIPVMSTDINNSRGVVKLSPDLLLSAGPAALETQYYYMNVNRKDLPSFSAQGAYGYVRFLLLGDKSYSYSSPDGGLATPNPKTLELVAGYDYTNANAAKAGIKGGISNDVSVTLNYYINKYMLARLRWSYTNVHDSNTVPTNHVNIIEARLQFKF